MSVEPPRAQAGPGVTPEEPEAQLGLSWLLKLRWGAVGGQLVALAVARIMLGLDLLYGPLLVLVAFTAATNAGLVLAQTSAPRPRRLPLVLMVDVIVMTAMLALSGGASNPFTIFYLVQVALAALLLDSKLAWTVVVLTVVGFATLFAFPADHTGMGDMRAMHAMHDMEGGHDMHAMHGANPWSSHLTGMWVAYVLAAGFIAHFVGRVSRAIRERDRRLAAVASLAAQNERLATLSSFSANAAHELGSPLATIGLAAKELSLAARRGAAGADLVDDAELVCREVGRCREILADLSSRAGESVGEMPVRTTPARVIDELLRLMAPALAPHLQVTYRDPADAETALVAPHKTLVQMLHNLIRNAFDAQEEAGAEAPVELRVEASELLCFHILDRGAGFPAAVKARLGEPFISTKSGRGLGLGIYLARAYAERTGGHLEIRERPGGGTDVELCLARNALRGKS